MTTTIREPGSAITHFIAFILAFLGAFPLILKACQSQNTAYIIGMLVFSISMCLLYGASTIYHSLTVAPRLLRIFKKLDHLMIFVLIAGSYTPVCLITLQGTLGYIMLAIVWSLAGIGMIVKLCWIDCPKWFSSVIYIAMGWVCVLVMGQLFHRLSTPAFAWLLTGGIIYTIGGIIYALKMPIFNNRYPHFGSHEVFHLFVMGGSLCHYICMYGYILS